MSGDGEPQAEEPEEQGSRRGALIGLLAVVLLIVAVIVVVNRIGASSKLQDCVQSGRTDCAPVGGRE